MYSRGKGNHRTASKSSKFHVNSSIWEEVYLIFTVYVEMESALKPYGIEVEKSAAQRIPLDA